ncbi:MAG TPA: hypothetical protein ENH87_09210 [Pricia antarctica]|uniref:Uncharacterized protein n=2 Tax=root TaxID=1 RepID=A0A831QPS8_9FLAO|nr:hypothetical protein [Pricia antarctica]
MNNFFKINLPYGIKRNDNGHWTAFNREYRPLGENDFMKHVPWSAFIYTDYGRLSDRFLMDLADGPTSVQLDENNDIVRVFFYDDATNPANHLRAESRLWENYFEKLKKLAMLKRV